MSILGALGFARAVGIENNTSRCITFLSDFGLSDGYVASVKGVLKSLVPQVSVIDITHSIHPQDVQSAAFVLSTTAPYFHKKTIHLAVVDPGVGTDRQLLVVVCPLGVFVAPDNGLLSLVLKPYISDDKNNGKLVLNKQASAVSLDNHKYHRNNPSPTFAGRDILAPVVAALCNGVDICRIGTPLTEIVGLGLSDPVRQGNVITGQVLYIDHFGNIITNISKKDLPMSEETTVILGEKKIVGLGHTYADKNGLMALIQSNGYLEIALNGGNAALMTQTKVGNRVQVIIDKP